jgi:hypothetical protein
MAGASRTNVKLALGAQPTRPTEMVPPKSPPWPSAKLAAPLHLINCHGADRDPRFFGSSSADFPTALESSELVANVTRGSVIAAECCYGAQLYEASRRLKPGIANTYLLQGAGGYCGSSNIAYGAALAKDRCAADILCVEFMKAVMARASLGRAMLEARQKFVKSSNNVVDPADEKTLGQFMLLGDPSLRPFGTGLDTVKKGLPKSLAKAAVPAGKALTPAAHRARRKELKQVGDEIARTKAIAVRVPGAPKPVAPPASMFESVGASPVRTLTFRVEYPSGGKAIRKAKGKKSATTSLESANVEQIQVTFLDGARPKGLESAGSAKSGPRPRVVDIHAIITRTRGGQVLSYKRISSK